MNRIHSCHHGKHRRDKLALTVGFGILAVAVAVAFRTPPTGYEVSLYKGVPPFVWGGFGIALLIALIGTLSIRSRSLRGAAFMLGGIVVLTVVGLPLIRGYYFYGTADALTHLGITKDLMTGRSAFVDVFYPAMHSTAVLVRSMANIPLHRSLQLTVLAPVVVFLVFTPLCVYTIVPHQKATVLGAFGAFLLLPINNISTHLQAHPFSQATLYTSFVLYLWLLYVTQQPTGRAAFPSPTPIGGLLALSSGALVLFHPQQAANVALLFGVIAAVQFAYRRFSLGDISIETHRPMYGQSLFLIVAFLGWTVRYDLRFDRHIGQVIETVVGYLTGTPPTAAESVQSHGTSLVAIGSSLPELFIKLFFVDLIFAVLAGVIIVVAILRGVTSPRESVLVRYLSFGVVGMLGMFGLYLIGGIAKMYFRHLGFIMVLATILGAVSLFHAADLARRQVSLGSFRVAGTLFVFMLVLTSITVHPSPTYYKETPHVTQMHIDGYETTFEIRSQDTPLVGFRNRPTRFADAVLGERNGRIGTEAVPERPLTGIHDEYRTPHYLVVSEYARDQEVIAYDQLRYTNDGFRSLDSQDGVSKVMSNGEVDLYVLKAATGTN